MGPKVLVRLKRAVLRSVSRRGGEPIDFLIAGVQKGGTTALWHYLRQHPHIALPDKKELHFFDSEGIDWRSPPYWRLHHKVAEKRGALLRGEATPSYLFWPGSLDRIASYNPHIRLIVCLREPVSRAYSHWRMQRQRGLEPLSFSEAIRDGRKRVSVEGVVDPDDNQSLKIFSYVERGFYAAQLDRACALFGREQILILKQSDLLSSRESVLDSVCNFLGIDRFEDYPEPETIFSHGGDPRSEMEVEDATFLANLYADDLMRLRTVYGVQFERERSLRFSAPICGHTKDIGQRACREAERFHEFFREDLPGIRVQSTTWMSGRDLVRGWRD